MSPGAASTSAAQAVYTCSWGTAATAVCPQVHWADNGYPRPQVHFSYSWDGASNLVDGSVTIYLNDYYGLNAYGRRQSVCHEMGHALGLGHDSSTDSCLYADILNSSSLQYPNGYDFALLNSIYSVVH